MLDYDDEARHYDATRGGEPRARAAAEAVERLLPQGPCTILDIACGTGIVTERLRRPERTVVGVDRSPGMLGVAARRLPGGVVRGDATTLPFASRTVDAVVIVWLLHLLPDPAPVLTEAARVLRPGGVLITTVDKNDAYFTEDSDIAEVTADLRRAYAPRVPDRSAWVLDRAAELGLSMAGRTEFPGTGQGRSPRRWREAIEAGDISWCTHAPRDRVADVCRRLAALPDQDTPRPDPTYRLIASQRTEVRRRTAR
ncbi:class I SAM-dependent methyltransferase [Streptomyces sp. MW-W600-10]|uniref:class I SAM-dependent methyltransferase n=1 Tax=Streptomyces sp. MW-W600-10 TaxID=2829819 RepID=UPI001C467E1F|nr:class I SAM-dependent methyltransferase [Streptomyces sp. MW-W600-10]MBV7248429.1 class I SAM-dependent methyltransferase [Streptomyces sp. MW-W600-10]